MDIDDALKWYGQYNSNNSIYDWNDAIETPTWDGPDNFEDYMGMILATAQDAEDYDDVDQLKMCLSEIATYAETALNIWNSKG
jgi:hypothetical protein